MMLPSRREFLARASSLGALILTSPNVRADTYPTRPIRLIVPFATGNSNDVIARPWADRMGSSFGPVVIENIAGTGGAVDCASVARAPADGCLISNSMGGLVYSLQRRRPTPARFDVDLR